MMSTEGADRMACGHIVEPHRSYCQACRQIRAAKAEGILEGLRMAANATCSMCAQNREGEPYRRKGSMRWWHAGPIQCDAGPIHDLIAEQEKQQ
jgi:hypothetical protein